MLLEKPASINDIACIKTGNGDEIIGKVLDVTDTTVTISKPMIMMLAQAPNGQPGIQMAPFWMLGGDKDARYPINRSHITCMVKAGKDAESGYLQNTTGLAMPGRGIIT